MKALKFILLIIQYQLATSSMSIQTLDVPNWYTNYAKNGINDNCSLNSRNKPIGICPLTGKKCQILINFNQLVSGCEYCNYNPTTKQCNGQCPNTFLQTCISKVAIPKKSSDCVCASCNAAWTTDEEPSCDASTCYSKECNAFLVSSGHRVVNSTLYCKCSKV